MVSITVPVPVPYGAANANSIYVRKRSDGSEKNITYYHLGHNILQRLNNLWTFTLDLVSVSADDKADWIIKNNEILIFWGTELRMKGRIEKISYDNYERCHIEGVGMSVLLRDQDIDTEYLNTASNTIVTNVNDSIMTVDTNTNYGLISMSFQSDNRLNALGGTVAGIDYDWWEDWKAADDYVTNYINVKNFKGDPDTAMMTFYTSGTSANLNVVEQSEDSYETTNYVTVLGAGDGVNQIKAVSFHATEDRTTLRYPLDAILHSDVAIGASVIKVMDGTETALVDGYLVTIDGEEITLDSTPSDNGDGSWSIDTLFPLTNAHVAGADVINRAVVRVTDASVLPASGNVWVGQEKITYTGKSVNDLTTITRGVAYLNGRQATPYYHGKGIEVVDAQWTKDVPDDPSYINTDGVRSRTFNQNNIIQQNMADYLSQRIRIDRQAEVNEIRGEVADPMAVLSSYTAPQTRALVVGDWVELSDTYTGFETGTKYEIVGMEYGFNIDKGEYCYVEISNYNSVLLENTVKETDNLGKYYKGATNIYQVNDTDNCGTSYPLEMKFYVPPEAVAVNKVLLSYSVDDYRIYFNSAIPSGGGSTSGGGGSSTPTSDGSYAPSGSYSYGDTARDSSVSDNTWDNIVGTTITSGKCEGGAIINYTVDPSELSLDSVIDVRINVDDTTYYPRAGGIVHNITRDNTVDGVFDGFIYIGDDLSGKDVDLEVRHHTGTAEAITAGITINELQEHTHNVTIVSHTHSTPNHTHTVEYAISEVGTACSDIAISIDDGQGYVDRTGAIEGVYGALSTSREQNLDITQWIGRETGWKGIKIQPTGNCRIRGDAYIQTFIQSKV